MGVKKINDIFKKYNVKCEFNTPFDFFVGKRIAVDLNNRLYITKSGAIKTVLYGTDLTQSLPDKEEIDRITLDRFYGEMIFLIKHNITPVVVFDGTPIPQKDNEINKRKSYKHKNKLRLIELEMKLSDNSCDTLNRDKLSTEYSKLYISNYTVGKKLIDSVVEVLKMTGIPVLCPNDFPLKTTDGEGLASLLCVKGLASGVYSNDTDVQLYGANVAILEIQQNNFKVKILEKILEDLKITYLQFQDMCILCGTDYNDNISRIGPLTAIKHIKNHGSFENLISKNIIKSDSIDYIQVRELFNLENTIIELSENQLNFRIHEFKLNCSEIFKIYNMTDYSCKLGIIL